MLLHVVSQLAITGFISWLVNFKTDRVATKVFNRNLRVSGKLLIPSPGSPSYTYELLVIVAVVKQSIFHSPK